MHITHSTRWLILSLVATAFGLEACGDGTSASAPTNDTETLGGDAGSAPPPFADAGPTADAAPPACADGTFGSACTPCTVCAAEEYEIGACTATTDRICSACPACAADQYETTACSPTTSRVCSACTACAADEYETTACTTLTNRACAACTPCGADEFETAACTATANRTCTACAAACAFGTTETTACSGTIDRVCTENALSEGFDGDAPVWTFASTSQKVVWYVSTDKAASGTKSLRLADPATGLYEDTGIVVTASATTPKIELPRAGLLTFKLAKQTESSASYDLFYVDILDGDDVVVSTRKITETAISSFRTVRIAFPFQPKGVKVRFRFDTRDNEFNAYPGVFVEDVDVRSTTACNANAPADVVQYRDPLSNHCYLLSTTGQAWDAAETACVGYGGHLAQVDDAAENELLTSFAFGVNASPWIGLGDKAAEGAYVWSTGDALGGFVNWAAGEPNNSGDEDCAHLYGATGSWNDLGCTSLQASFCEIP